MEIKIIVDAMGGDFAPKEIVLGAIKALKKDRNLKIILVGDEKLINPLLEQESSDLNVEVVHTDQFITMEESPKAAIKEKSKASINLAMQLLAENQGDALVSAGSTGATILSAAKFLPVIPGIERSALATVLPTARLHPGNHGISLLIDVGATLHCTAKQLVHFAYMGSYYVSHVLEIPRPRVALLNNGTEETKGGEVLVKTYRYLKEAPNLNFIGNIEGTDILKGTADVIVTEGFVGNIVLKTLEGASEILKHAGRYAYRKRLTWKVGLALLSSGVRQLKKRTDYSEYGGAPILGFKKLVIKAHGRSNAKAIANAIGVARQSVEQNIAEHIGDSIIEFNKQHRLDFIDI
ncbi:Phosphate acyltransferase [Caldithrix abyssi DSM 13497]|uniref:Phosphate acyltransferase n=1 Tax=Caldithrix abyssi DSM 13497 TaxID=880073 RepID=H1XUA1_CALAY|nr:phosphate acyltransferase PlsX [Caldithrix abyssi]APF17491.1 plsX phosphate:acyl-(acyl carrier protein) acyltransferase [Caldithrix abyssi DSM 13497]EHO41591.1 Phosphate acyltransferase [Caldithrix abyssi DSM 13497]